VLGRTWTGKLVERENKRSHHKPSCRLLFQAPSMQASN